MSDIEKEVKESLDSNKSADLIEQELREKGFLKQDIDQVMQKISGNIQGNQKEQKKDITHKFLIKELLDRAGYGLGSEQYINILFFQSGAALPIIALVNGFKAILSSFLSSFIKDYSAEGGNGKKLLSITGIIFGFSFIVMAIATYLHISWLFTLALLTGVVGVVAHGELYQQVLKDNLRDEKRGPIELIYRYGLVITIACLLLGAVIIDRLDFSGLNSPNSGVTYVGYLLVFQLAAILFILSGYVMSLIEQPENKNWTIKALVGYLPLFFSRIKEDSKLLLKQKTVILTILASSFIGLTQIMINTFYGIYIYEKFRYYGFGGFLNVAMISILALAASLIVPAITKENLKAYSKYPLLIFGTLLISIMPLAFYFNPNLVSIAMGTILGVTGAAMVGITHGLLSSETLPKDIKGSYFGLYTILSIIPYLFIVPLGAYLVGQFGLEKMFLFIGLIPLIFVLPIYLTLMIFSSQIPKTNEQK